MNWNFKNTNGETYFSLPEWAQYECISIRFMSQSLATWIIVGILAFEQIFIAIRVGFVFIHCCTLIVYHFRQVLLLMLNVYPPKWYGCWWMKLFCVCNKKKIFKNLSNCRYSAGSFFSSKLCFVIIFSKLFAIQLHLASSTFWAYINKKLNTTNE